jgi:hypothetical protein
MYREYSLAAPHARLRWLVYSSATHYVEDGIPVHVCCFGLLLPSSSMLSVWRSGIAQIAKLSPCGQHITTATPDTAEEFHRGKEKEKSGQRTI